MRSRTLAVFPCALRKPARAPPALDLSRKYLEWGKRNFALNGLNASGHDFIAGDVFDWLRRLAKKQQRFDLIALDPPTFSQSKEHGVFQAEKDFGELVTSALPLLNASGRLVRFHQRGQTDAGPLPVADRDGDWLRAPQNPPGNITRHNRPIFRSRVRSRPI
jgi:tRNA1(Val) A37 N6-methylase TrmN6